jgi:hypothetical protein
MTNPPFKFNEKFVHPAIGHALFCFEFTPELWNVYQETYGAIMFGARWNGTDVEGLSKDEALEHAAFFLKSLADWVNREDNDSGPA